MKLLGSGRRQGGTGSGRQDLARIGLALTLVCGVTLAAFHPLLDHGFLELDDTTYVTENSHVRQGLTRESIAWAWTSVGYAANWHPLAWLSHMADVEVFGLEPRGHHLSSLLLHLLSAAVLGLALVRMTGAFWRSFLVSALFAVHPLHVESVAWIAERKDVLSGFLCSITLLAYARYARAPSIGRYVPVALLFACGLAAKQTLVTLPLMLLAVDIWPLGRWPDRSRQVRPAWGLGMILLEKIPLLLLSAGAGILTLVAQSRRGMVTALETVTVPMRLANAALSAVAYLRKTAWPSDLAFFYAFPEGAGLLYRGVLAALLLAVCTGLVLLVRRRYPWLLSGWVWYSLGLLPVIGLIQVGQQSMADRYTYLPLTGIFIAIVWSLAATARAIRLSPPAAAAGAVLIVLGAAATTRTQVGFWRDGEALFERALAVTEGNWLAENNYGYYLYQKGRIEEAGEHYREALRYRPQFSQALNNLGMILASQGSVPESIEHFRAALAAMPGYEVAHFNLGSALLRVGSHTEALGHFKEAARLRPGFSEASFSAGFVLEMQNKIPDAARYYRETLRANPGHAGAQQRLSGLSRRAKLPAAAPIHPPQSQSP